MTEQALLFANEMFYRAFADRDMEVMETIWANDVTVSCLHPGWGPLEGRDDVMTSWHSILTGANPPNIECVAPRAVVLGDSGIVICHERIGDDYLVATNVFVRRGSTWTLVHHQAGPTQEPPQHEAEGGRAAIN